MYLWFLSIPAQFRVAAIPLVIMERLLIALGITLSFHSVKAAMKAFQEVAVAIANARLESSREPGYGIMIPVPAD